MTSHSQHQGIAAVQRSWKSTHQAWEKEDNTAKMEFSVHKLQKMKVGVHIAQAVLIFITWIMDIVVFRKASINGGVGWHFGLVSIHSLGEKTIRSLTTIQILTSPPSASSRSFQSSTLP